MELCLIKHTHHVTLFVLHNIVVLVYHFLWCKVVQIRTWIFFLRRVHKTEIFWFRSLRVMAERQSLLLFFQIPSRFWVRLPAGGRAVLLDLFVIWKLLFGIIPSRDSIRPVQLLFKHYLCNIHISSSYKIVTGTREDLWKSSTNLSTTIWKELKCLKLSLFIW